MTNPINPFEPMISGGLFGILGDPNLIGILVISFFSGIMFIAPTGAGFKALIIGGAAILAAPFIPIPVFFLGIVGGIIVWFAASRILNR